MKVKLLVLGKTDKGFVQDGVNEFHKRIAHYVKFSSEIILPIKGAGKISPVEQKEMEGEKFLQLINPTDFVILLDENGDSYTSTQFAVQLNKYFTTIGGDLVFIVGGAYGFGANVYKRANSMLALSKMTFSHQLIRVIFLEQLYRGLTILNNHPYHNE
jgi:23S rRNA (pseudouridine1915-N3)-methyltransferase